MKTKRYVCVLLALVTALSLALAGCSSGGAGGSSDTLPTVISSPEYVLYENIFYNGTGADYAGQKQTKTGTFATLRDSFNGVTRYYVWGYYDSTKCCDWQWEFVPKDPDGLPANGSLVEVSGTFEADDAALDGYWLTDAEVSVKTAYTGPACDVDMTCMSGTLERVQVLNMQNFSEEYEGMSVYMYGRMESLSSLQHPYYDGAFSQELDAGDDVPAIGTMTVVSGTWENGVVGGAALTQTSIY